MKTTLLDFLKESTTSDNNFQKWFKGSKVVDSSGEPMVVYHGSRNDFDVFYEYSFFTDDYMNADGYASGEYIYEVYLSIKNPLIIDCQGNKWNELNTPYGETTIEVAKNVDNKKYDGIIFQNIRDSWIDDYDYQEPGNIYLAFKPNQISRQ